MYRLSVLTLAIMAAVAVLVVFEYLNDKYFDRFFEWLFGLGRNEK
jgi:hypothetical protein